MRVCFVCKIGLHVYTLLNKIVIMIMMRNVIRIVTIPNKKRSATKRFFMFSINCENTKCILSVSDQILLKPLCGINEYMCFSHAQTEDIIAIDEHVLDGSVRMELRVFFAISNSKYDINSLMETYL